MCDRLVRPADACTPKGQQWLNIFKDITWAAAFQFFCRKSFLRLIAPFQREVAAGSSSWKKFFFFHNDLRNLFGLCCIKLGTEKRTMDLSSSIYTIYIAESAYILCTWMFSFSNPIGWCATDSRCLTESHFPFFSASENVCIISALHPQHLIGFLIFYMPPNMFTIYRES